MIGKLYGIIDTLFDDCTIINVGGVGYMVACSSSLLNIHRVGDSVSVHIHTLVKDEQIILYGFSNLKEKEWFLRLQEVQGVGAKMAMLIVGSMKIDDIINSILAEDAVTFKAVPGIGQKIASRIVNELKNHKSLHSSNFMGNAKTTSQPSDLDVKSIIINDAISVLVNLGFSRKDAFMAATNIRNDNHEINLEDLIKKALSTLSSQK